MVRAMNRAAIFLLKFFVIFFALHSLLYIAPISGIQDFIAEFEANALGLGRSGNIIMLGTVSFEINQSCTGLVSVITLAAVVFALRKPGIKIKFALWLLGAVLLFAINLARVYFVLWVALTTNPNYAETLHVLTWFAMAAAIIAIWYAATKHIAKIRNFSELL